MINIIAPNITNVGIALCEPPDPGGGAKANKKLSFKLNLLIIYLVIISFSLRILLPTLYKM